MKPTENWRPVPRYEGLYEVSDRGQVKRVATGRGTYAGRLLKPNSNPGGYQTVSLHRDGRSKTLRVHRLVLSAFVGPCPPGMEGCHGDGNPANNRLDNLRWDTGSANTLDKVAHGTHNMSRKTHCSRGHELVEPNLVPSEATRGKRTCRACKRAHHAARSPEVEFTQDLADAFYAELMQGLWVSLRDHRAARPVRCLQCGESRAAVRESQRRRDPIYCGAVDYFGEVEWEAEKHRFKSWTDKELIDGWRVLPEHVDKYRRIMNGYEINDEHRAPCAPDRDTPESED